MTYDVKCETRVRRNPLAYPFALFSLGGAHSGGGNVMITVAVIGLLAAIAIPSFVKARETAQRNACINNMEIIDAAKEQAALAHNHSAAETVTEQEASQFIKNGFRSLRCLRGGSYTINPVGQDPECSMHGALSEAFRRAQRFPNEPSDRTQ